MSRYCFWILTDGTIVTPGQRHILAVVHVPSAFGETVESLEETFKPYGQKIHSNYEGKAREETLIRVINRNHIRIRKNQHKRNQHWSLQLYELTNERKRVISKWAKYVSGLSGDKFADVIIYEFKDRSKKRTSLKQLAGEYTGEKEPEIVTQTELSKRYE